MKNFMLIFMGPPYESLDLSPEEIQKQMGRWFAWVDDLKAQDKYVGGDALKTPAKRIEGENQVITDGPFVEAKELVGGYFIIKVKDDQEATEIAKSYPDFTFGGSVEIREVMVY